MGAFLSFEVTGGDKVLQGVTALLAKIQDLTPFWRDIWAPKYFGMVQDLFATSGTPRGDGGRFSGPPWEILSPKYRVWKFANYPNQPILTRTGALRDSLRWSGSGLGSGGIFQATPTYAIAGTSIPYGQYHHHGTGNMPKREFLPPPDPAVFAPLMKQWLMKTQA